MTLSIKSFQFRPGLNYHKEEISLTGKAPILETLLHMLNLDSLLMYAIHVNGNIHFFEVKHMWIYLHDKPNYKNVERVAE